MREAQTLSQVLERLYNNGYVSEFKACEKGMRIIAKDIIVDPECLVVEGIYRLEGETDLNEEVMILALSCPKEDIKGTYVVAFGRMMDPLDQTMVMNLREKYDKCA